jgi:hypothetical protein
MKSPAPMAGLFIAPEQHYRLCASRTKAPATP